jgi:hypothetical protein
MVIQLYKYYKQHCEIFRFSPQNRDIFKFKNEVMDQKKGEAVGQCLNICCCCVVKKEFQAFAALVLNSVTASIVRL